MHTARGRALGAFYVAAAIAAAAAATPRVAFVTSTTGSGDLSSWAETNSDGQIGGDAICVFRATNASPPLDNPSSFRAWLSIPLTDAYCHLYDFTGESPTCGGSNPNLNTKGPWVRTDGEPFAAVFADLIGTAHALYQPVLLDENGDVVNGEIWTGTNENGIEIENFTCSGWASTAGNGVYGFSDRVARGWTYNSSTPCSEAKHLLCLESAAGDTTPPPSPTGALVFVTSSVGPGAFSAWAETNSNGLIGGDEICRTRAAAAHVPNSSSFFALLSDVDTDAVTRVTYGGPFVRIDGFPLADAKTDLFGADPLLRTGLDVTEAGNYLGATADSVWSGSTSSGTATTNRCVEWQSGIPTDLGALGSYGPINSIWISGSNNNCSNGQRLYCFSNVEILFWDNFEKGSTRRWTQVVD